MEKDDIHLGDWKRILIGNAPVEFLSEVLVRTIVIYIVLLVIVKLLGKRLSGRVTLTEMALIIALGAIVGSPMEIPERGIVVAIAILLLTLIFQRIMNGLSFHHNKIEQLTQGKATMLVKDGDLQIEQMRRDRISEAQLFAALREHTVSHLGEVKRVYLEINGDFSIIKDPMPKQGKSVYPEKDTELAEYQSRHNKDLASSKSGDEG